MPRVRDKRERLLAAARTLIHHQGFRPTTLADIAKTSGIPLGNVYYYFKTKEDLGAAVIKGRAAEFRDLFDEWDRILPDPHRRLAAFIDFVEAHREELARHGCPVGSLCQELDKETVPLAEKADGILQQQVDWAIGQFRALGRGDAEGLGAYFVAMLQGITLVAHARRDPGMLEHQAARLRAWLEQA